MEGKATYISNICDDSAELLLLLDDPIEPKFDDKVCLD
jgi:hypothetical protein